MRGREGEGAGGGGRGRRTLTWGDPGTPRVSARRPSLCANNKTSRERVEGVWPANPESTVGRFARGFSAVELLCWPALG